MKADEIIDRYAAIQANTEDVVEDTATQYQSRVLELVNVPSERMPSLWSEYVARFFPDPQVAIGIFVSSVQDISTMDYTPPEMVAVILAASRAQATLELRAAGILQSAEKQYINLHGKALTAPRAEIQAAAKRGVSKAAIAAKRGNNGNAR